MSAVKSISCPNCGGSVELRGLSHTLSAVCVNCLSVLDASTPQVRALQQFQESARVQPRIPLGTRGKLEGHVWEAMGFQVRALEVEGVRYTWDEYLLFNPYQGFRYLSEYNGHWNFIRPAFGLPLADGVTGATYQGVHYKHFQASQSTTVYAMGEFPWKVQVNDQVPFTDFIAPPRMLSRESTEGEITWSVGLYKTGEEIGRAFQVPQGLPPATGVFANQPNPHQVGSVWTTCLWLTIALFAAMMVFGIRASNERLFYHQYRYTGGPEGDAVTTPEFTVKGSGPQNVEIHAETNLNEDWLYLNFFLVNVGSGDAYIAGRDFEAEGNRSVRDSVTFSQVPPGKYYLRVEPEMDKNSPSVRYGSVYYDVQVWRDVPHYLLFWLAIPLMAVPAIWATMKKSIFETQRWQESDHAP